jgi:hypothetical protein
MARFFLLIALSAVAVSLSAEVLPDTVELVQETEGTIGCKFWRVRSITDTPGQWWQVKELEFYTSTDGSGDKLTPAKAMASTFKGDLNESENKPEKAIDGSADTFWSTSDKYKFEWIGVEFDAPQEVLSVKMQLTEEFMGPSMVIVEKSMDGEWWSRSTEITDMADWANSMVTYPLLPMNRVPESIFALRSQQNPHFCVGVRPTPHPSDDKADPYPLFEDAKLEIQICNDKTNTQYWQLAESTRPMLKSAADQSFVMHINGSTAAGSEISVKQCLDGCPEGFDDDIWQYAENAAGGLMYDKNQPNLVLAPKGGVLEEGVEVVFEACGAEGELADASACSDKSSARWELLPMFVLEPGKQTIACAPYSHDNVEPSAADSRAAAQEACAANPECVAYNWADGSAEGILKNKVYSCTAMHEIHSGMSGWELGVRAGTLEPFAKLEAKEMKQRTWTLYADM